MRSAWAHLAAVSPVLLLRSVLMHHNRRSDGVARLPDVRFLIDDGIPTVVALGEGRDEVLDLYRQMIEIPVPGGRYCVTGTEVHDLPVQVGVIQQLAIYRSLTPWLGLNQANHRSFQDAEGPEEQRAVLEPILVGNLLVAHRQLGVELAPDERVMVAIRELASRPVEVRGQDFTAFKLGFTANVLWPSVLGLGKQVSKGSGRFERVR